MEADSFSLKLTLSVFAKDDKASYPSWMNLSNGYKITPSDNPKRRIRRGYIQLLGGLSFYLPPALVITSQPPCSSPCQPSRSPPRLAGHSEWRCRQWRLCCRAACRQEITPGWWRWGKDRIRRFVRRQS